MRSQSELKQALVDSLRSIWDDDGFALQDNARSNRLRAEILRRLIGLVMTDDDRAALRRTLALVLPSASVRGVSRYQHR